MQLVQAGKLSLSDNLAGFVPGLPWGHEVTISELLDHTSGIADYINSKGSLLGDDCPAPSGSVAGCRKFGPSQVIKWLASQPLQFAPGTKWAYSNSNYYLLGLVIERVSGLPYLTYVKSHILDPLGLTRTQMCPENPDPPQVAVGYIPNTTTTAPWAAVGEGAIPASDGFAAGELCSNVEDLLKWSYALAHGQVVSAASYDRMTRPTRLANGTTVPYGFGLQLATPQGDGFLGLLLGQPYVGHTGGQPGFSSVLVNFPKPDLTIVVLCNTETGPDIPFSVASGVLCLLHQCP
jgi:CubicO group peptidase (beta-lactamase class C family)